jgi:hypothetical protein
MHFLVRTIADAGRSPKLPGAGNAGDWNPQGPALLLTTLLHLLGWLLATAVVAAITRTVTRN